jgi:hypothetical protein
VERPAHRMEQKGQQKRNEAIMRVSAAVGRARTPHPQCSPVRNNGVDAWHAAGRHRRLAHVAPHGWPQELASWTRTKVDAVREGVGRANLAGLERGHGKGVVQPWKG